MLTLKEKLQLFKLAKKPRKQIRLRLQVITNDLNLPSIQKTTKQLFESSSFKQQKVITNINNFKKVDTTKHYISQLARTRQRESSKQANDSRLVQGNNSCIHKSVMNDKQNITSFHKKSTMLHHSCSNTELLLSQFNFYLTRDQKQQKRSQHQQSIRKQNFMLTSNQQHQSRQKSLDVIKLKNELNSLQNLNCIYKGQLENAMKIEKLQWNANRMSQLMIRSDDLKDVGRVGW